jgi:hypothetical protein
MLKAPASPLTMTGLGGPIRRTSAFSAAMIHSGIVFLLGAGLRQTFTPTS